MEVWSPYRPGVKILEKYTRKSKEMFHRGQFRDVMKISIMNSRNRNRKWNNVITDIIRLSLGKTKKECHYKFLISIKIANEHLL